jgi:tetratricopeptide (TPR) repeat protein
MARNNYGSALGAIGENEAAKAQYREAIRLDGDGDGGDWVGLGQCFAREGDFETARDMYLKAIALVPGSDEPVFRRMLAGREFELGTAYEGLTREFPTMVADYRADALGAYRRAIELYPEYEDPRVNLSMLLHDAGRDEEAIEQCRAILAYDPESVAAHTNLGQIFYFEGKLDESLAEYRAVLKIDGENVGAMASAAAILAQQGQVDEAIDMLKKAHAIDPENALVNQDLAAAMAMKNGAGR